MDFDIKDLCLENAQQDHIVIAEDVTNRGAVRTINMEPAVEATMAMPLMKHFDLRAYRRQLLIDVAMALQRRNDLVIDQYFENEHLTDQFNWV